jgi:hypothetical protein
LTPAAARRTIPSAERPSGWLPARGAHEMKLSTPIARVQALVGHLRAKAGKGSA